MKTLIIENQSCLVDAMDWIRKNGCDAIKVKNTGVRIDLSAAEYVNASIVGFFIYLLTYYTKNNIAYEIIPPENALMLNVFGDIIRHFEGV